MLSELQKKQLLLHLYPVKINNVLDFINYANEFLKTVLSLAFTRKSARAEEILEFNPKRKTIVIKTIILFF